MRLSSDEGDPGYVPSYLACSVRVFLDGFERLGVITADEEKRSIVMYRRDESGHILLNAARTDAERETLCGDVRIDAAEETRRDIEGWLARPGPKAATGAAGDAAFLRDLADLLERYGGQLRYTLADDGVHVVRGGRTLAVGFFDDAEEIAKLRAAADALGRC